MGCEEHQVIIIGGGPAGLSAALWLSKLEVPFLLLERGPRLGGQLERVNLPIRDYLGCTAANGRELLRQMVRDVARLGIEAQLDTAVRQVDASVPSLSTDRQELRCRILIVATGLSRRRLERPGVQQYLGRGVSYSATSSLREIVAQPGPACVIGGGDGAFENALILAEVCPQVTIVQRGAIADARRHFVERVVSEPRITVLTGFEVERVEGDGDTLQEVVLRDRSGDRRVLPCRWLVVKVGYVPNTGMIMPGTLELDAAGYIVVDRFLHGSAPGVLAAGDVANPRSPCLAAAVGDGAVAAREAFNLLSSRGDPQRAP